MNKEQRGTSIISLAELIANRIISIKQLHAEKGENPSNEIARQFALVCERKTLRSGPLSTQHMELLATELVPEAMERLAA
jgi:hypothetical protein